MTWRITRRKSPDEQFINRVIGQRGQKHPMHMGLSRPSQGVCQAWWERIELLGQATRMREARLLRARTAR